MQSKKCTRNGCKQAYNEDSETECYYHPGKPIFHDLKKGWTCCNVIVFDWDEFQKIKPCATGKHTDSVDESSSEFFKSSTVQNAQKGLDKFQDNIVPVKNIDDFNREQAEKKRIQEQQAGIHNRQLANADKKPFLTVNGKYKCINKGCLKEYDQNDPNAQCNYHSGEPCFHDLKKFWTCCKVEKYDWDEFMKIPTCTKGEHKPKMQ